MAEVKRLVCLANSRKLNGSCVAGIELVGGRKARWIRPVSARAKEEVFEASIMSEQPFPIFTIGHSTHSLETFAGHLRQHDVTVLADVRSSPFSRFNPQFNKDSLERGLKALTIQYVFLGRELGARPTDPSCYENGHVSLIRLSRTELFHSGLDRVMLGAKKYRIALMCAEKEPLECHRTILVARALVERGATVEHIHADGRLESYESALSRLLDLVGLPSEDMFQTRDQLAALALMRQAERIAYVDESASAVHPGVLP